MNNDKNIDLLPVIANFLEQGLVENIVIMFKRDSSLYSLSGKLISDKRFNVRLGTAVLFEELATIKPQEVALAIPALLPILKHDIPLFRGEAATILGIIGTPAALQYLEQHGDDPDPQVQELITDILIEKKAAL